MILMTSFNFIDIIYNSDVHIFLDKRAVAEVLITSVSTFKVSMVSSISE